MHDGKNEIKRIFAQSIPAQAMQPDFIYDLKSYN